MNGIDPGSTKLRLIGYWKSRPLDESGYLLPHEFVVEMPRQIREKVIAHLESCDEFAAYRGISSCRFCGKDNGFREFTDGVWVWPEGLPHYLREHGITLPEEFIEHVLAEKPRIRRLSWDDFHYHVDVSYWKQWCATHRSRSMIEVMESEKKAALENAARWRSQKIAELERKLGVSEARCIWVNCENRALIGRVECAAHIVDHQ